MSLPSKLPALAPDRLQALAASSTSAASVFTAAGSGDVTAALAVAESIADLRTQFEDPAIKARILALQDTPIGFRTDRDPKINRKTDRPTVPYDWETVKDCVIEAMLRGLQIVGNQFNIIAGRQYITKEGFEYLIRRRQDVTLFQFTLGVPRNVNGGVIVSGEASWHQNNTPRSLKAELPVKQNEHGGVDQTLGKATRKLLARCYTAMTGTSVPEGDAEDADPAPQITQGSTAALPESTTESMKGTAPAPAPRPRAKPQPAAAAPVGDPAPAPAPAAADPGPGMLPEEEVEQLLANGKVDLNDFFGWLVTIGLVKDASLMEHVGDVPPQVLKEILTKDAKGVSPLAKCIRLYGHA